LNMTPYENIKKLLYATKPSMKWDGKEPVEEWQKRSREKLAELIGLGHMIKAEKSVEIEYDKSCEDFREIRLRFQSEPGYFVPCHLLIPNTEVKSDTQRFPTVICLQGHSKGMHISLGRVKYPGEQIAGDRDFAIRAIKEGFCALVLEQRDFGECGGNEKGPQCTDPTMSNLLIGRTTIGERVWDVMRAVDMLISDFSDFVKQDEIYVLGNSGGGTCSVYAGAIDTRLAGSVPSCAVSSFAASIGSIRHCVCNYVPNILNYFDMGELLALTAPRKLVVVNGELDDIFPLAEAKEMVAEASRVYAALGRPDRIAHVIGAEGHRFYADGAWAALKSMN
jgi:hypothetical protein